MENPENLFNRLINSKKGLQLPGEPKPMTFASIFDRLNKSLGNALTVLKEQPQAVIGRETEITQLYAILERPITPVALLLGEAGTGKTAIVEQFAKELNSPQADTKLKYKYVMLSLNVGSLASIGTGNLQAALSNLLFNIYKLENMAQAALGNDDIRFVLFIDEVHMLVTIFGAGTKIGGDVMKALLARSPVRVIAATTRREYDSTIAVDQPLAQRFKPIEISELPKNVVVDICKNWWQSVATGLPMIDDNLIKLIIEANAAYRSDSAEPRKTLDILEDLVSHARRTGTKPTRDVVNDIFKIRFSINLKLEFDADKIFHTIENRILGQPYAMYVMRRLIRSMAFQLDDTTNKPLATALFTGSSGTGKTETAKALSEGLYPNQKVLLNLNMPDFKSVASEELFRKRLGEFIRHTPNAIILFDEIEKAHVSVLDSMLSILDEGIVHFTIENREGHPETHFVSLRNAIVIGTTNAGAEVFEQDAQFSKQTIAGISSYDSPAVKAEVEGLLATIIKHLQEASNFKPELLGRFSRIVPYRALTDSARLSITEKLLKELFDKLKEKKGIEILIDGKKEWPGHGNAFASEIAMHITYIRTVTTDPNMGGARKIVREINSNVLDTIVEAVIEHPGHKRFKMGLLKESRLYNPGAHQSEGGIYVKPI